VDRRLRPLVSQARSCGGFGRAADGTEGKRQNELGGEESRLETSERVERTFYHSIRRRTVPALGGPSERERGAGSLSRAAEPPQGFQAIIPKGRGILTHGRGKFAMGEREEKVG